MSNPLLAVATTAGTVGVIIGSSFLLRKKHKPEIDNLESRASKLWEFLCQEPSVFNSRKMEIANELLEENEISDRDDLAFLFKNKKRTIAFFNAVEPLLLQKKVGLFRKEYSNFIIPLLPSDEEEEDDPNEVSANLMVQLDSAVDQNAPASQKPSSPPTDLATPRTSLVLPSPSAMVSSELDLLKELETLHATVQQLQARQDQMDAEMSRLLAMVKEMKKTASQPLPSELENMKSMFAAQSAALQSQFEAERKITLDAKAKEAQEAAFEAKLAEKDARIKALTATKAGKTCVEDDEDDGDGEDEDDDGDGRMSELTNRSPKQKPSKPDNKDDLIATIESELIALRKRIIELLEAHFFTHNDWVESSFQFIVLLIGFLSCPHPSSPLSVINVLFL